MERMLAERLATNARPRRSDVGDLHAQIYPLRDVLMPLSALLDLIPENGLLGRPIMTWYRALVAEEVLIAEAEYFTDLLAKSESLV